MKTFAGITLIYWAIVWSTLFITDMRGGGKDESNY